MPSRLTSAAAWPRERLSSNACVVHEVFVGRDAIPPYIDGGLAARMELPCSVCVVYEVFVGRDAILPYIDGGLAARWNCPAAFALPTRIL